MLLLTLLLDHGVPAHTPAALWLTSFFQKEGMAILIFILNNKNNFRKGRFVFVEIASVQSLLSSQRLRVVFCARHCPLGNVHSHSPVQPWMSPWAEAVGLFSLWKRSWSGTSHTFCCPQRLQGPWSQLRRVSTGKGQEATDIGCSKEIFTGIEEDTYFPLSEPFIFAHFPGLHPWISSKVSWGRSRAA